MVEYNNTLMLFYIQQEQDKMNDELHQEEKLWKEKYRQHEVCICCFAFIYCCFPFERFIIFEDLKKHYCILTQLFECIKGF